MCSCLVSEIAIPSTYDEQIAYVSKPITEPFKNAEEEITANSKEKEKQLFLSKGAFLTEDQTLLETIYEKSEQYKVDPYVALALVKRESDFDPETVYKGAFGLTQITVYAYREYIYVKTGLSLGLKLPDPQPEKLMEIGTNIEVGMFYLSEKIKKYDGNLHYALMAYNGGDKYLSNLLKRNVRTTKYSRFILDNAEVLRLGWQLEALEEASF